MPPDFQNVFFNNGRTGPIIMIKTTKQGGISGKLKNMCNFSLRR